MFSKRNKKAGSQQNKTKEELIADLQKNAVWMAKIKFIKETFYPALIKATTSIEDATQNLTIINSVMMEKFLGLMKEKKFSELDVYANLDPKDPKYEDLKAMLNLFDGMSLFEAKEYLEGMKQEIAMFIADEQKVRGLDTLPTKWIDEI
jgi:ribosomal protein L7/L12